MIGVIRSRHVWYNRSVDSISWKFFWNERRRYWALCVNDAMPSGGLMTPDRVNIPLVALWHDYVKNVYEINVNTIILPTDGEVNPFPLHDSLALAKYHGIAVYYRLPFRG